MIEIDYRFDEWIEKYVLPRFEEKEIKLTQPARIFLAYVMQAQLEDQIVPNQESLFERAGRLLEFAPLIYGWQYRNRPMNINRALHLVVETNLVRRAFPTRPSIDEPEPRKEEGGQETGVR